MPLSDETLRARFAKQFGLVLASFPEGTAFEVAPVDAGAVPSQRFDAYPEGDPRRSLETNEPVALREDLTPGCVYEADVLLARDAEALAEVLAVEPGAREEAGRTGGRAGVHVVRLPPAGGDGSSVREALQRIRGRRNVPSGAVTPNHLVSICSPNVNLCPADEPVLPHCEFEPVVPGRADPAPRTDTSGAGTEILVIDTGLVTDWDDPVRLKTYPWMAQGDVTAGSVASLLGNKNNEVKAGVIHTYVGHGTFIAGVARCVAPEADVKVSNLLRNAGTNFEHDFATELLTLLDSLEEWPQIISLSAGVRTLEGEALLGMETFVRELVTDRPGTLLVAAAGNHDSDEPFYPAYNALDHAPAVISVGALDQDEFSRSEFSDFGPWVSVYARGRQLVNAFAFGSYTTVHEPSEIPYATLPAGSTHRFEGMAMWSGTSFATPIVAGLVAARMSEAGETSRQAAAWLLERAAAQTVRGDRGDMRVLHARQPVR
ncbi:S8 family serine peptidase [Microbispora sp. NPDC049125]|uniref:S8 family peptidase n=1 Tax=Microbispora sp. NPDC049125 TaxID=3154929 RepID=UPI003464EF54